MKPACQTVVRKVNLQRCIYNCATNFIQKHNRVCTYAELRNEVGDVLKNYNQAYVDRTLTLQLYAARKLTAIK